MPSNNQERFSVSGKTQQKTKNRRKNPLKSGNPAVAAAARANVSTQPKKAVASVAPESAPKTSSTWTPSGNPEPAVKAAPKPRTPQQKKKDRFRKFGQITIVLFFLGSMILTSFAGLGNLNQTTPAPEETNKVLVDQNGNPIGGNAIPAPAQEPVPADAKLPAGQPAGSGTSVDEGASNVIEIPAK